MCVRACVRACVRVHVLYVVCKTMVQNCNFCHGLKVSSYIAQYPIFRIAQASKCFLHFTPWQTCSNKHHLIFSGKHSVTRQFCEDCSYTNYLSLSIAKYSFIQLSELEQCTVKKLAQGFRWQHRIRNRVLLVKSAMLYP